MPPNKDAPGCFACPPGLICLPPISEDLQLIWTQAAQTSELDGNQHLLQTFSYFPYPSLSDLALLCLRHGLHMEKVKAWFMAQRLRCGISWSAEEIEETRARLIYHQDQLHFSCLLDGSNGDSCLQSCKSQEYHQPPPAPLHHPVKYENQQCDVTSSSRFSTAQEIRELGRISEDVWEQKGNGLYHPSKAQENCQSAFHHSTKETLSGAFLPAAATGLDYKLQNSHTAAWGLTKTSLQPSEPVVASAVNGKHHSAVPPPRCSVRASPSSSAAASTESCSLQNYQSPACDQQQASGCCSEILRKPRRKTKEQLDMLKSFFLHCQWAKREDYHYLEQVTGLPRAEIIQWFGDTRYALKHGQLKWFRDNAGQSFDPALSLPSYPYHPSHPDTKPLQRYWESHPPLQDNGSPRPCQESDRSRSPAPYEVEVCLSEEEEEDEEMKAALLKEEDEDYEEEEDNEEDDDNDEDWTM
ncbi:homeobox and leucine zipper protein Homez [Sphaerodactylus townsendi]|uniref:homeobox and leucine zipper protein Homez n=1 Tax=Sphaerodactylus townsendi TaxID=933632 RepID=UPI002025F96A|nr:homeobox and leucine zipper protein Homez [Sphaerodactylus townsendi]XP_048373465.1 homeobox and leucine zipper protein Homez [Sphaerodactylus townsendi]XP_048373466.1 homeobox and leucine zipper protein Homez [Sphaerodactylus townsendi]XP_048373467.1 homeobox and leucine zipper protein Homez [Sphaerodactylus townsendi]XP_048373468.1 homeobox and leucine zipper protein Homez [Sphaerodactylus townsendi]XP_048373470.1 homeobox and leucine zipper protein Homez [Sphaerodactylus townsendi]XP_04